MTPCDTSNTFLVNLLDSGGRCTQSPKKFCVRSNVLGYGKHRLFLELRVRSQWKDNTGLSTRLTRDGTCMDLLCGQAPPTQFECDSYTMHADPTWSKRHKSWCCYKYGGEDRNAHLLFLGSDCELKFILHMHLLRNFAHL